MSPMVRISVAGAALAASRLGAAPSGAQAQDADAAAEKQATRKRIAGFAALIDAAATTHE